MEDFYTTCVQLLGLDIEKVPTVYREEVKVRIYGPPKEEVPVEEIPEETETPTETTPANAE
jgi:hypothetical protein